MSKSPKHCWHPTGASVTYTYSGETLWMEQCCRCGAQRQGQTWRHLPEGHGPFLPQDAFVSSTRYEMTSGKQACDAAPPPGEAP